MNATLEHLPGCDAPVVRKLSRHGNPIEYCNECGARRVLLRSASQPKQARPVPLTGQYRCPEHLERAVTWRGRGCPDCANERRRRRGRTYADY